MYSPNPLRLLNAGVLISVHTSCLFYGIVLKFAWSNMDRTAVFRGLKLCRLSLNSYTEVLTPGSWCSLSKPCVTVSRLTCWWQFCGCAVEGFRLRVKLHWAAFNPHSSSTSVSNLILFWLSQNNFRNVLAPQLPLTLKLRMFNDSIWHQRKQSLHSVAPPTSRPHQSMWQTHPFVMCSSSGKRNVSIMPPAVEEHAVHGMFPRPCSLILGSGETASGSLWRKRDLRRHPQCSGKWPDLGGKISSL